MSAAQWREQKDRPAILAADRALAFAAEQHELAREDLLAKAYWALDDDQLAPAAKLFKQASELDPGCQEARAGLEMVQQIRDGKLSKEQLFEQLKREHKAKGKEQTFRDDADRASLLKGLIARNDLAKLEIVKAAAQPAPGDNLAPPGGGNDVLQNAEARQAVADQQATQLVEEAIRRANRKVLVKPAEAIQDLKQTLEDIRNNPDIDEKSARRPGEPAPGGVADGGPHRPPRTGGAGAGPGGGGPGGRPVDQPGPGRIGATTDARAACASSPT